MKNTKLFLFFVTAAGLLLSCGKNYTPKELGYFRIDLPEKKYLAVDSVYPYTFEIPVYADLRPDPYHPDSYNSNIVFPKFNGTIHLSYFNVTDNIEELIEDNRKMVYKHTIKADAINEQYYKDTLNSVYGVLYEIKGNAASSVQFYVTDSSKHFLRGALYFNNVPNKDSIAPVSRFVEEDVDHLIKTLSWK
jgi:gliding motility-associated lipoprotein GldD